MDIQSSKLSTILMIGCFFYNKKMPQIHSLASSMLSFILKKKNGIFEGLMQLIGQKKQF